MTRRTHDGTLVAAPPTPARPTRPRWRAVCSCGWGCSFIRRTQEHASADFGEHLGQQTFAVDDAQLEFEFDL